MASGTSASGGHPPGLLPQRPCHPGRSDESVLLCGIPSRPQASLPVHQPDGVSCQSSGIQPIPPVGGQALTQCRIWRRGPRGQARCGRLFRAGRRPDDAYQEPRAGNGAGAEYPAVESPLPRQRGFPLERLPAPPHRRDGSGRRRGWRRSEWRRGGLAPVTGHRAPSIPTGVDLASREFPST